MKSFLRDNKDDNFAEPFVINYQEAIDNEKVCCDCDACINIMVHQALVNKEHLDNTSYTDKYLDNFERFTLGFDPSEVLCLYSADTLQGLFYDFNKRKDVDFSDIWEERLTHVYSRFDVDQPQRTEIESFARYITDPNMEKYWCKSSMIVTCLTKEIRYSLFKEVDNKNKKVIDFLENTAISKDLLKTHIGDIFNLFPQSDILLTGEWFTETCMRMWFRSKKYGSLENSEFAFKAKLSWLYRCIPEWSKTVTHPMNKKEKICLIRPESNLNNIV